jgi:hypothetical protein
MKLLELYYCICIRFVFHYFHYFYFFCASSAAV